MPRVVLAMSGGVDSSVAAFLLKQQGYEVIGLFMRTGVHAHEEEKPQHKKGCCSAIDAGDGRRVADRLDIPFYALDFEQDFERIIDYFADEYLAGRTPNPCVVCNNWLKFGKLWEYGQQLGADFIATGHYARVLRGADIPVCRRDGRQESLPHAAGGADISVCRRDDRQESLPHAAGGADIPVCRRDGRQESLPHAAELHRAVDPGKDQSYVLFGLKREILERVLMPIGGYRKDEIRALAREAGLAVADKPDSVEICFVPGGDHGEVIRKRRRELTTAGQIVDRAGNVLAEHPGIENFTIGQRKGLGYAAGERRYVLEIVPAENKVVVGEREELLARGLRASRVNWLVGQAFLPAETTPDKNVCPTTLRVNAKIRYRHTAAPATVSVLPNAEVRVEFDEPQSAVTPGQAVVFYDDTRVLGGGWIEEALNEPEA